MTDPATTSRAWISTSPAASTRFAAGSRPTGGRVARPRIEDFLCDVPDEGRPALRAELEALVRELCPSEDTVACPATGPPSAAEPPTASNPSTIAEAPTIAPGPPKSPVLREPHTLVHEEAALPPSDQQQLPYDQPTAVVLGQDPPVTPVRPNRPASATSAITSCSARSPAAAWGWSTGRGRSA